MNVLLRPEVNFVLTNRLPRRTLTRFTGWFSRIEQPLVRDLSLAVWRWFGDLDLADAKRTGFRSMHDCFTRELRDGARPPNMDPAVLVSPSDAIIGACGQVRDDEVLQIKGRAYALTDLLGDERPGSPFHNGCYATLRLTSGMYHRFHAPHDCQVRSVSHFPGDVWNVNAAALNRVDRLFCRNERAVIVTHLSATGHPVTLVPVAAILVAGIRLRFMDLDLRTGEPAHMGDTPVPGGAARRPKLSRYNVRSYYSCGATLRKGEEMGWFEHGSTIVVLAAAGFTLHESLREGMTIRAGQPLMRLPDDSNRQNDPSVVTA